MSFSLKILILYADFLAWIFENSIINLIVKIGTKNPRPILMVAAIPPKAARISPEL